VALPFMGRAGAAMTARSRRRVPVVAAPRGIWTVTRSDVAAQAAMRAPFLCFQSARMGIAASL